MGPSKYNMFLLLIGLTLSPVSYSVKMIAGMNSIVDDRVFGKRVNSHYTYQLEPNQVVPTYTRASDETRRFAFIAHDPSKTTAEVTVATLFSTAEKRKTCQVNFSNPYGGTPIFLQLDFHNDTLLWVKYTTAALQREGSGWIKEVDTSKCSTNDSTTEAVPSATQPWNSADWNSTNHFANVSYSAEDILESAEVNSMAGYIFTRKNNETSTSIMFANKETGETTVLDVNQDASGNEHSQRTYTNGKIGYCSMNDTVILCNQTTWHGKMIMNFTHIQLPKKVDWFGVYNLKSPAMLVVTLGCSNRKCRELTVRKLEDGDKISKEVQGVGFGMSCENAASILEMYPTYGANYENICFNFVCMGNDYIGRRVFQYRRQCIEKDNFESN